MFDSCPTQCGLEETRRSSYCETCPAKRREEAFLEQCEEVLDKELQDEWREFTISYLLESIRIVAELENIPSSLLTVTAAIMLEAYQGEEGIKSRIENYNKRQDAKASGKD